LAVAALIFAEVKNPDTIITVTIGEPDTLDPHYAYDTASGEVLTQIYECLIEYVGDSVIQMAPRLATTVPSLENLRSGKQPSAQG
jgi:peptide/nickel transport system substrate-binding protein